MQMLKDGEPITAAELREMTIRHITADPDDQGNAAATACFLDAYVSIFTKTNGKPPLLVHHFTQAERVMQDTFDQALGQGWHWPKAIPINLPVYPKDILIQVALHLAIGKSIATN